MTSPLPPSRYRPDKESIATTLHDPPSQPTQPRSILQKPLPKPATEDTCVSGALQSPSIRRHLRRPSDETTRGVPKTPETSPMRGGVSQYYSATPSRKIAKVPTNECSGVPGVPRDELGSVPKRSSSSMVQQTWPRPPTPAPSIGRKRSRKERARERLGGFRKGCGRGFRWLAARCRSDLETDPCPYGAPCIV